MLYRRSDLNAHSDIEEQQENLRRSVHERRLLLRDVARPGSNCACTAARSSCLYTSHLVVVEPTPHVATRLKFDSGGRLSQNRTARHISCSSVVGRACESLSARNWHKWGRKQRERGRPTCTFSALNVSGQDPGRC